MRSTISAATRPLQGGPPPHKRVAAPGMATATFALHASAQLPADGKQQPNSEPSQTRNFTVFIYLQHQRLQVVASSCVNLFLRTLTLLGTFHAAAGPGRGVGSRAAGFGGVAGAAAATWGGRLGSRRHERYRAGNHSFFCDMFVEVLRILARKIREKPSG